MGFNHNRYYIKCLFDKKFMRDSTKKLEDETNVKLRGWMANFFSTTDKRFNKFSELWKMSSSLSLIACKRNAERKLEIDIDVCKDRREMFSISVLVQPEKYIKYLSRFIKCSPGGNVEVKDINKIPDTVLKIVTGVKKFIKSNYIN